MSPWVPSWLCLEAVVKNRHETYQCRMYSRKLLMMGREDFRNMQSFIAEQIWIISASCWLFNKKSITMHGNMNDQNSFPARHGILCWVRPAFYLPATIVASTRASCISITAHQGLKYWDPSVRSEYSSNLYCFIRFHKQHLKNFGNLREIHATRGNPTIPWFQLVLANSFCGAMTTPD